MKYLKAYKIFESNSDVDTYLNKMGATREDIQEIFFDVTDQGYNLGYGLVYKDRGKRVRKNKTTSKETPILKISISTDKTFYVGGTTKFKNISYIEAIYHSLSRFINTYKDKAKIDYEIDSKAEIMVNCTFEEESDDSKLDITKEDLITCMDESLSAHLPDYYITTDRSSDYQDIYYHITMSDSTQRSKATELVNRLKGDADFINNHKESGELCDNITNEFTSILSKRFDKDIRFYHERGESPGVYLFENGEMLYKISELSVHDYNSRIFKYRIKKGFLSKKNVDVEIYYNIEIKMRLS